MSLSGRGFAGHQRTLTIRQNQIKKRKCPRPTDDTSLWEISLVQMLEQMHEIGKRQLKSVGSDLGLLRTFSVQNPLVFAVQPVGFDLIWLDFLQIPFGNTQRLKHKSSSLRA